MKIRKNNSLICSDFFVIFTFLTTFLHRIGDGIEWGSRGRWFKSSHSDQKSSISKEIEDFFIPKIHAAFRRVERVWNGEFFAICAGAFSDVETAQLNHRYTMLDCTRGSVVSDISQCVGEISGRDIADRMYELRGKLLPCAENLCSA